MKLTTKERIIIGGIVLFILLKLVLGLQTLGSLIRMVILGAIVGAVIGLIAHVISRMNKKKSNDETKV